MNFSYSEDNVNDELLIAYIGPEMEEAGYIIKDALYLHFSKSRLGWYFTTNTVFKTSGLTVAKIL